MVENPKESQEVQRTSPLCIVVLIFPDEVNRRIRKIQEKYNIPVSRKIRPIGSHLTIKSQFYPVEPIDVVEKRLAQVTGEIRDFTLEFNAVNHFGELTYISVSDSTAQAARFLHLAVVENLKDVVCNRDGSRFELDDFIPHVTISEGLLNRKTRDKLSREEMNFRATVGSFSLFYTPGPEGLWIPKRTFTLSKG